MKKQTINLTHLPPFQNHTEAVKETKLAQHIAQRWGIVIAVKVRIVSDNKILTGSIEWGHKKKIKTPKGPGVAPEVD